MKPKISVIMPVFNQAKFIKQAVSSILDQSYRNFELIVVDDNSKDSTYRILRTIKDKRLIIIKNNKNIGLTKSINLALRHAQGEFIARMDGDDIAYPNRFKLQLGEFARVNNLFLVGGQADLIDQNGKKIRTTRMPTDYQTLKKISIRYNPFIHPTIMFKKALIRKIGYYNEKFRYAQDYDFILKALSRFQCKNLEKPILGLRVGQDSTSISKHNRQQITSVLIRLQAIFKYNYPLYNLIFVIKPFVSALIPIEIKRIIYPKLYI